MARLPFICPTREAPGCARSRRHSRGFTLVEVLVALAVLAIAVAACMRTLSQAVEVSARLRDHTLALWIAQDRLAVHRLQRDWPEPRDSSGTENSAGYQWFWTEHVLNTPEQSMRRIEIEVRAAPDGPVAAHIVGFVRKP